MASRRVILWQLPFWKQFGRISYSSNSATSDQPVTNLDVARAIPSFEALDWSPMADLGEILGPLFLGRPKSKKPINRFTLNFTTLLRHSPPESSQLALAFHSAQHFSALLKCRGVSESALARRWW